MAAFNRLSGADSDQITQDAQHTQAVDAQFIGAISKTKMLIVPDDEQVDTPLHERTGARVEIGPHRTNRVEWHNLTTWSEWTNAHGRSRSWSDTDTDWKDTDTD